MDLQNKGRHIQLIHWSKTIMGGCFAGTWCFGPCGSHTCLVILPVCFVFMWHGNQYQQANSTDLAGLAIYNFAIFYHWYSDILYIKEVWIAMVTTKPANITVLFCSGAGTPQKILALKSWPINHRMLCTTESSLTSGNPRQRLCIYWKNSDWLKFLLTSLVRKLSNFKRYCMHWTAVWQWYMQSRQHCIAHSGLVTKPAFLSKIR